MNRISRRVALVLALAFCGAACGSGPEEDTPPGGMSADELKRACEAADLLASETFASRWDSAAATNTCSADDQCVLDNRDVTCAAGSRFTYCPLARAATAADAFASARQASTDAACAAAPSPGCMSATGCGAVVAACVNSRCRAVPMP